MKVRARRPGFVLIDVAVGLAIASVTVLLTHAAFATWIDTTARAETVRGEAAAQMAVRRQLVNWIRAASLSGNAKHWDFFGRTVQGPDGATAAVLVLTTSAPGAFNAGQLRLTLAIDRDPNTPERGLVAYEGDAPDSRVDTLRSDHGSPLPRPLAELVPHATGFYARYLYSVAGTRRWTSEWASSANLPEAVEIIVFGDSVPPLLRAGVFVVPRGLR